MTTIEIIKEYLVKNGYDGLYYYNECACGLDDLHPCGENLSDCQPGYKTSCDCEEGCDFHISEIKPEEEYEIKPEEEKDEITLPSCPFCGSAAKPEKGLMGCSEDVKVTSCTNFECALSHYLIPINEWKSRKG